MLYELEHSTSSPKTPVPNKTFNSNNKTIQKSDEIINKTPKESSNIMNNSNSSSSSSSTQHINGINLPKNSNPPISVHTPSFSKNGSNNNGNGRCVNGKQNHHATDSTSTSTSTSDSDDDDSGVLVIENGNGSAPSTPQKSTSKAASSSSSSSSSSNNNSPKNSPKSNTTSPNSSLSSYNSTLNSPKCNFNKDDSNTISNTNPNSNTNSSQNSSEKCTAQLQSILKRNRDTDDTGADAVKRHKHQENNNSSTQNVTKLVPYEVDDSSSSIEDTAATLTLASSSTSSLTSTSTTTTTTAVRSQIVTKAGSGSWQISPNTFHGPSHEGQTGWRRREREAITELVHMSHEGYSAPVTTWNGTRAALDREINNERREDRKRTLTDNNPDKCKVKQAKHTNSYMTNKSNPGYNPFQVC